MYSTLSQCVTAGRCISLQVIFRCCCNLCVE